MKIDDEIRINEISKGIADRVKYAGQSEGLSKWNIAINVGNCAQKALMASNDTSEWMCWLSEAADWILIAAGLHCSDIGMMMTKQEDEIHGTLGRR